MCTVAQGLLAAATPANSMYSASERMFWARVAPALDKFARSRTVLGAGRGWAHLIAERVRGEAPQDRREYQGMCRQACART